MEVTVPERIKVLEEVLDLMDECARKLPYLRDKRIEAYCLADFEGREGGWLGTFVRDIFEEELREARKEQEGSED